MIAVTFALPAESSAFVRRLRSVKRKRTIVRGRLPDFPDEIYVVHTGVGAIECKKRLDVFLKGDQLRVLISSGFCGGASDQVSPGNIVIAENFSEPGLRDKARAVLTAANVGNLFSADEVIDPAEDRYAIGRKHGAIAIDMETETIARICAEEKIPMLALRVVSDSPAAPFPAPPNVLFDVQAQRAKFSKLFAHLAREPSAAMRLAKFSRQINKARENLAEALCAVIPVL